MRGVPSSGAHRLPFLHSLRRVPRRRTGTSPSFPLEGNASRAAPIELPISSGQVEKATLHPANSPSVLPTTARPTPTVGDARPKSAAAPLGHTGPTTPPTAKKSSNAWLTIVLVSAAGVLLTVTMVVVGLWFGYNKFFNTGTAVNATTRPSPSSSANSTISAPPSSAPPTPSQPHEPSSDRLGLMVGTWSVDPNDPLYQKGRKAENELNFKMDGQVISGVGPGGGTIQFSSRRGQIVAEGQESDGTIHSMEWRWIVEGQKAQLTVTRGTEKHTVIFVKGEVQTQSARPSHASDCLYRKNADLNGVGSIETVEVIVLEDNLQPNAPTPKLLKISSPNGQVLFQSERFEEPFRVDLDSIAEAPDQVCGLHIMPASPYPRIRLIFTPRSGNFVDFGYDGRQFGLSGLGTDLR